MIDLLMWVSVLIALAQPTKNRAIVALVWSVSCLLFGWAGNAMTGDVYYISAGIVDFLIMSVVYRISRTGKFTDCVLGACFVSILLNFYGWWLYETYQLPTTYNYLYLILYIFVITFFLKDDEIEADNRSFFRMFDCKGALTDF